MLKDDKMMSLLTVVIIMVAVGTLAQRMDVLEPYFGSGPKEDEFAFVQDDVIVRANTLTPIDVLANDTGLEEGDAQRLIVVDQPACGRVFARNGVVEYLPAERCVGQQIFAYAISGRGGAKVGEVYVTVRLEDLNQAEVAPDAERDSSAASLQAPGATDQTVAAAPQAPAAPNGQSTAALGETVQAPSVPQPAAPSIGGLSETTPSQAANAGAAGASGVASDGAGTAPNLSGTPDQLSGGLASASAPTAPLPVDPAAPSLLQPSLSGLAGAGSGQAQPQAAGTRTQAQQDTAQQDTAQQNTAQQDTAQQDTAQGGTAVLGAAPQALPGASGASGTAQTEALAALRDGAPTELTPVNTAPPAGLGDGQQPATATPQAGQSATAAAEPCDTPPSLTLDVRPAAITYAIVESPCHKGSVAELAFAGLRFALAIDSAGTGTIAVPGFEKASDAELILADGARLAFNIPFSETEKTDRVALATQSTAELQLHAFEFGAAPGTPGHVSAQNPRAHSDVRRAGGGYMLSYAPIDGVGQAITVYTFWRRDRGSTGVVKLDLGLGAARSGAPSCGDGAATGQPDYIVVRSHAGRLERPDLGVLAPVECGALAMGGDGYLADAIGDIVVRPR